MTEVANTDIKSKYLLFKPKITENNEYISIFEEFKTKLTPDQQSSITNNIKSKLGEEHPFDYLMIEGMMQKFGLVNSVLDKYMDFTIGPGYEIESDNQDIVDILKEFRDKTQIDNLIGQWFKEALGKGSGYLEIASYLLSNSGKNSVKNVNSNQMYVKRDDFGIITGFTQYIGKGLVGMINDKDINPLGIDRIVQLNLNKIGTSAYGYGIVYSAMEVLDNFLMVQNAIHKLTKRKANVPIHVKLGNEEKDDYPSSSDVSGFGNLLTYMNEVTEWVTGPNVEMNILDFGNIGDKFQAILENDYKMISYCFQIPESIMGSSQKSSMIGTTGMSDVQRDGFNRRILSLQTEVGYVLKNNIYDKVLLNNGVTDFNYKITWNQVNEEAKNSKMDTYQKLLSTNISEGMRKEIEKKLALLIDVDYADVEDNQAELQKQQSQQADMDTKRQMMLIKKKESVILEKNKKRRMLYNNDDIHEKVEENVKVSNWINKDMSEYKEEIIENITNDDFFHLLAENNEELNNGYLEKTDISVLKEILIKAVKENNGINDIKENLQTLGHIKDLVMENGKILNKDKRMDMIAKTELTRVLNNTLIKMYEKGSVGRPATYMRWDAVLDEKTCPICEGLSDSVFTLSTIPITDRPPIHPNCRCHLEQIETEEDVKKYLSERLAPQEMELYLEGKKKEDNKIDEFIKKVGDEYCVFSHQTHKNFGCYKSKAEAEKRLAQIHKFA